MSKPRSHLADLIIVEEVQRLLSSPHRWCQGALARDGSGNIVIPSSPCATQWCTFGAFHKVMQCASPEATNRVCKLLGKKADEVLHINDRDGYQYVVMMLDEAIKRLRANA